MMKGKNPPKHLWQLMVLLVLLAFAWRLFAIEKQSLRGDEALSVIYAQRPLKGIIEITRFISGHPPLFYAALHFWEKATGTSELTVRFFAAWWGVLAVPLVFVLGKTLFSPQVGLWAALLVAVNPFQIMHSQDIRVYTLLQTSALLSCLWFWKSTTTPRPPHRRYWVFYILSSVIVVYAHYFGVFLILAQAVFFVWYRWRRRGPWREGILSLAIVGFSLLPWLWLARSIIKGAPGSARSVSLPTMFQQCLVTFGVGYWREKWGYELLTVGLVLLFGLGVWKALRTSLPGAGFATLLIVVPLLGVFFVSRSRPLFRERYLIISAPAYTLFWSLGLTAFGPWRPPRLRLRQLALGAGVLLLIGFNLFALTRYYFSPAYAKSPNWRGVAAYLREHLQPDDAVILNHHDQAFLYYYSGPNLYVLPAAEAPDPATTEKTLQDLIAHYDRIWLQPDTARGWDKEGLVRRWLDRHCDLVMEWHEDSPPLLLYHTPRRFLSDMLPLGTRFGEGIELLGYRLAPSDGDPASGRISISPGQAPEITLYWRCLAPLETDYTVFVHLLDSTGRLRGQQDNPPVRGTYPTSQWKPDEVIVDKYQVGLAPDAPAGLYRFEVGLYFWQTGERLPVFSREGQPLGDHVFLGEVHLGEEP